MSKPDRKGVAERALERAVDEATKALQAELAASKADVKALHEVLSRIAQIAFGAAAEQAALPLAEPRPKLTLPAELAVPPAPAEEPIWHEPPIELADADDLGPGRFV